MHRRVTDDKINKALDAQVDSGDEEYGDIQATTNQLDIQSKAAQVKQDVQGFLNRGSPEDAMKAACKENSKQVIELLVPVFNDIVNTGKLGTDKFCQSLTTDELDVCMKYTYKSMEALTKGTSVNISNVLAFHEKVTQQSGVGSIVRVITDTN